MGDVNKYFPWNVGDYLRDTLHLRCTENGGYLLLLAHAWMHDGEIPLESEKRQAIARMTARQWKKYQQSVMSFWTITSTGYRQKRLTEELKNAHELYEARVARTAAARAAKQRSVTTNVTDSVTTPVTEHVTDTPSPSPSPSPSVLQSQNLKHKVHKANGRPFILPPDIDPILWAEFLEMRQRIRKPATNLAQWLIVGKLANIENEHGHPQRKVLQQSIRNSWQDVFPLREDKS